MKGSISILQIRLMEKTGGGQTENDSPSASTEPSFKYQEQYAVTVMCKDEEDQQRIYERLTGEGYDCRVVCV